MKNLPFSETLKALMDGAPRLALSQSSRVLIVSDLHVGDGSSGDDFLGNERLFLNALDSIYLKDGWTVVLNGDIEELHKFDPSDIRKAHPGLYSRFDFLHAGGRLRKLVGNHDLGLLVGPKSPYPLHHALVMESEHGLMACFHGHQASRFFSKHNYVSDFIVRYLAHPLRIKNADRPRTSKSRFKAERRIYKASKALGCASVIGHTHRPLFESMDKWDTLSLSLDRLLAAHPASAGAERERIEAEIGIHAQELRRLSKKRRPGRGSPGSLYEKDGLPVPCLFNSGCVTARGGFTAIEIEIGSMSLVKWAKTVRARPWIEQEAIMRLEIPAEGIARYTLMREPLNVIFSKIRLLGGYSPE